MRLWLELAAAAGRGRQPEQDVAGAIIDGFVEWVADRLELAPEEHPGAAALLLATIDGLLLFDATGRTGIATAAANAALVAKSRLL